MMTIEQFRSNELAKLYSKQYVEMIVDYHADVFRAFIESGEICAEDPEGYFVCEKDPEGFEKFEKAFPKKEKLKLLCQLFLIREIGKKEVG